MTCSTHTGPTNGPVSFPTTPVTSVAQHPLRGKRRPHRRHAPADPLLRAGHGAAATQRLPPPGAVAFAVDPRGRPAAVHPSRPACLLPVRPGGEGRPDVVPPRPPADRRLAGGGRAADVRAALRRGGGPDADRGRGRLGDRPH